MFYGCPDLQRQPDLIDLICYLVDEQIFLIIIQPIIVRIHRFYSTEAIANLNCNKCFIFDYLQITLKTKPSFISTRYMRVPVCEIKNSCFIKNHMSLV